MLFGDNDEELLDESRRNFLLLLLTKFVGLEWDNGDRVFIVADDGTVTPAAATACMLAAAITWDRKRGLMLYAAAAAAAAKYGFDIIYCSIIEAWFVCPAWPGDIMLERCELFTDLFDDWWAAARAAL